MFIKKLLGYRKEAILARRKAGLDEIWRRAREQYKGIDERNRPRTPEGAATLDGPLTTMRKVKAEHRSSVFCNITRPYTNAGTGRVLDIVFATGKMPWKLRRPTVSDMQNLKQALAEVPAALPFAQQDAELAALLEQPNDQAGAAMEAAERIIRDWFKENGWTSEMRKMVQEAGQVGTGVIKGPVPVVRVLPERIENFLASLPPELQAQLNVRLRYSPRSECIKVENCFPAPGCGTDIQNGDYFFELIPTISRRQLARFAKDPTYLAPAVMRCLEEGPKEVDATQRRGDVPKKSFDLWVYTGEIPEAFLDLAEGQLPEVGDECACVFGSIVFCNDHPIKVARSPLDSDVFPYHTLVWEPRENSWAGVGIPEQIETPQRGLNATVRALQDNLGYSVGPQVIEWKGLIEPADGDPTMYPYKRWIAKIDGITSTVDDVAKAFTFLEFPNYTAAIMPVISFWLKMAEDTTALPLLLQGQAVTDSVGVSQQLQNNATTNLRLVVKNLDAVIVAQLRGYYDWVQQYGPQEARGDAVPEALGSAILITRELQQQALMQVLDRSVQPVFGLSPKKAMAAFLEGFQLDAEQLGLTDEERQQLEAAQAEPDPKVQAEQLRVQMEKYRADLEAQVKLAIAKIQAQVKGLSLDHAKESTELNAATQVTMEAMRQGKDAEPPKTEEMAGAAGVYSSVPHVPKPKPLPEPSVEDALATLGLG